MARPDHAFRTATHTVTATGEAGVYRADPGGHLFRWSLEAQELPPALRTPAFERAAAAWVIARGGRSLALNGERRPIAPQHLDRPARGPVRRLVSIAPSNAEIVGALDATDRLVGVESSSDWPPEVTTLPRLGPDLAVDVDALAALQPDLVLASLSVPGMERNLVALDAALDGAGLPMLVLAPRTLDGILADIARVGAALNLEDRSSALVATLRTERDAFRARAAQHPPLPVYLEWWPNPMFTPGRDCWSNELIALAGGRNVFGDRAGQSLEVSAEELLAADPAVLLLSWCGVPFHQLNVERVLRRKALAGLPALRAERIHPIDESFLGRPGPRVLEGVRRMAEVIAQAR